MTQTAYRRFLVLSEPRTGSHMLVQALNSHPQVTCFREVFNGRLDVVDFSVDGYDNFSARDMARRKEDPVAFLHERIFSAWPGEVRAVGFKLLYGQHWDFPGILDALAADRELHVVRLRRRNALRMLVSLRLAEETGVWLRQPGSRVRRATLVTAVRHPLKAARRLGRRLRGARPGARPARRVRISPEECFHFIVQSDIRSRSYDKLFGEHATLEVFYEDMQDRREEVFGEVQSFVGVEPAPLRVTLVRQNPAPLRGLIENYDELYEAFKDTPQAALFED